MTGLKCFIGGSALLTISQILGIGLIVPIIAIPYLITIGAFSIAFSIMLFLFGLREIGSMQTGVLFFSSSLFGALFALVVIREPFSLFQIFAGLIMLVGIYVLYKK